MTGYPNLELLDYKAREEIEYFYPNELGRYPRVTVTVFIQTWGNTATGFDLEGGLSGQAFTDEYTTVVRLRPICNEEGNYYFVVCFGNKVAYVLKNPTNDFYNDLHNMQMKSQKDSVVYTRLKK